NNFIERSLAGTFSFLRDSVFSDEYAAKNGFLQARDSRLKALGIFLLLLTVLFSRNIYFLIAIYALCLFLAAISSIHIGFFLKRTWIFIPLFSLFIALPALFEIFTPGEALVKFRLFNMLLVVTRQGVFSAGFFFIRVLTSTSLCVLLVLSTRQNNLLKALRSFRVPQVFVMTLGMCYRYIYLFMQVAQDTYLAIKSRVGFVSSAKRGQGIVAWNIAGLWQRSYQAQAQVYSAMLSRGYTGEPKIMDEVSSGLKDWIWLGITIIIFGLSLWQNRYLS
ncbi:MAG: cobalt ECF transporter T component CbiQ, partial [Candidatus Omnitrophica bacterium]|nr:cobalt ECF transporter T component CbiQ [Candidatus Omnitrophota bacterium]